MADPVKAITSPAGFLVLDHEPMLPDEFATIVVLPTVREFLTSLDDQRRMYLACVTSFHLLDHIARAANLTHSVVCDAIYAQKPDVYEIIRGISNGTKHAGTSPGRQMQYAPGQERRVPAAVLDSGEPYMRLDKPGLAVRHNDKGYYTDHCVLEFLETVQTVYGNHFPSGLTV